MRRVLQAVSVALALGSIAPLVAHAAIENTTSPSTVADGEKRGYWWKKAPPSKGDESVEVLPPPPTETQLLKMHPSEIEKLIESYRENALFTMTPEHVVWYYTLQDFARRRSRAFMNVTELVMLEHPELNMQTVYPTNPPGQAARIAQRDSSRQDRLVAEREGAALLMLARRGCGYCEAMRAVLKYFQEKYGWSVREVDLDQTPAAAAQFATDYTPTTVVIFRDSSQWMPVAIGVETLERLEEGVYRALRFVRGETAPEQFTLQEFNDGGLYDPKRSSR